MSRKLLRLLSVALLSAICPTVTPAADTAEMRPGDSEPPVELGGDPALDPLAEADSSGDNSLDDWMRDLNANDFNTRQQASQRLFDAGARAVPRLAEAATGGRPEVADRAWDILQRHFSGEDETARTSAEAALQQIAASDAPAAQRARQILEPPATARELQQQGFPMIPAIQAQRIQFRVQQVGGGKRISIKNNNGNKEIEAVEGDRKVKITEAAGGKIEVEITDKKDGKETTKKFSAKNAAELKKNHPDAHKEYEKYNKQGLGGVIQIQAGGIQVMPGGILPIAPGRMPRVPQRQRPAQPDDDDEKPAEDADQPQADKLPDAARERAIKRFTESAERLRKSVEDLKQQGADAEQIQRLEESLQRLERIKESFEEKEG